MIVIDSIARYLCRTNIGFKVYVYCQYIIKMFLIRKEYDIWQYILFLYINLSLMVGVGGVLLCHLTIYLMQIDYYFVHFQEEGYYNSSVFSHKMGSLIVFLKLI